MVEDRDPLKKRPVILSALLELLSYIIYKYPDHVSSVHPVKFLFFVLRGVAAADAKDELDTEAGAAIGR